MVDKSALRRSDKTVEETNRGEAAGSAERTAAGRAKGRGIDIRGNRYGRLTAIEPTEQRSKKGYVIWRCRCDCGTEVMVSYNVLRYTNMRSCGCSKKEHDEALRGYLTYAAGTSLEAVRNKKRPVNNSTGQRGVYYIAGRYVAKIVFQKKPYYLGNFHSYADAVQARLAAERLLFDGSARHLSLWRQRATDDPEWAAENPVQIVVTQQVDKSLSVMFLPELTDSFTENEAPHEHCAAIK